MRDADFEEFIAFGDEAVAGVERGNILLRVQHDGFVTLAGGLPHQGLQDGAADAALACIFQDGHAADVAGGRVGIEGRRQQAAGADRLAGGIARDGVQGERVPLVPFFFDGDLLLDQEHGGAHGARVFAQRRPGAYREAEAGARQAGAEVEGGASRAGANMGRCHGRNYNGCALPPPLTCLMPLMRACRRCRAAALLFAVTVGAVLLCAGPAGAASFDCAKARSKLTRVICADAELSRLDQEVWDAYGARIKTLSSTQYAQVRDRHITWRRQRGLYEQSVAALLEDYRRHLAWLTHPLLPLEGRYVRADGAELQVEIDLAANAALTASGRAGPLQWLPPRAGLPPNALEADQEAGMPRAALPVADGGLEMRPNFIGRPQGAIADCGFVLRWAREVATLSTRGACGGDFAGEYALQAPDNPWPRSGPYKKTSGPP